MTDEDLLRHVVATLRELVGAPEGALVQVLRERLVTVALAVGACPPATQLDLTDDQELLWWLAEWIFAEGEAVSQGSYSHPQIAEALGRRFLGYSPPVRRRHVEDVLMLGELTATQPRTYKETQLLVDEILAGNPPVPSDDVDSENLGAAYLFGLWLSSCVHDAHQLLASNPDPTLRPVGIATPPTTDFLSTWLLSVATEERGEEEFRIRASSSRTRAHWTRVARALSALGLATYAYGDGQPEPLVS